MKKTLLLAVVTLGLLLVALSGVPSWHWTAKALAQAGVCQFAAFGPGGGIINTNITCATPSSGPVALPSPTSTTTAGAPSLTVTSSPAVNTLVANFPASSGGGGNPPFTIVQDATGNNFNQSASTTATATFGATATTGNTLVAIIATDGSVDTITTPSGWTKIFTQTGTNTQVGAYIKTSAGSETGVSFTLVSTGTSWAVRLYEINGTHALDHDAVATVNASTTTNAFNYPALTPSAGSMVFAVGCVIASTSGSTFSSPGNWTDQQVPVVGASGHIMDALIYRGSGAGAAIDPPQVTVTGTLTNASTATGIFSIL